MFDALSDRMSSALARLSGGGKLSPRMVEEVLAEVRLALLEADVALPVVREFITRVSARALSSELLDALEPHEQVLTIVHEELTSIMGGDSRELELRGAPNTPAALVLLGLQGAGKTTTAGKLASRLRSQGRTPFLVPVDLARPAAVAQLAVLAERAGVGVALPPAGLTDPLEALRLGLSAAADAGADVVIIDTAGRTSIDRVLMEQAGAIIELARPTETLLVLDAMTGQDAAATATAFGPLGVTGLVLSKLDGDSRGGAALSAAFLTQTPILLTGTGEGLSDLERFHPDRLAHRILDMGDVASLVERAEASLDKSVLASAESKILAGEDFDLSDFLNQLRQVRRLGSLSSLIKLLPGAAAIREQINQIDERVIDRTEAMISSMTPQERTQPALLASTSRRRRVAAGAGVELTELNDLLDRFATAQQMMRSLSRDVTGGGLAQMPGLPGLPGLSQAPRHQPTRPARPGGPSKKARAAARKKRKKR